MKKFTLRSEYPSAESESEFDSPRLEILSEKRSEKRSVCFPQTLLEHLQERAFKNCRTVSQEIVYILSTELYAPLEGK